jgi:antitoxin ParD1/3/4
MGTMNVSLPDAMRDYVEQQVATRGYGTSSEYLRDLIRQDQDRQRLRAVLLEGARSKLEGPADAAWFAQLRQLAREPKRA